MIAKQLKNYLSNIDDMANVWIFVAKINEKRQLRMADLDLDNNGNLTIDAEYIVLTKRIKIDNPIKAHGDTQHERN